MRGEGDSALGHSVWCAGHRRRLYIYFYQGGSELERETIIMDAASLCVVVVPVRSRIGLAAGMAGGEGGGERETLVRIRKKSVSSPPDALSLSSRRKKDDVGIVDGEGKSSLPSSSSKNSSGERKLKKRLMTEGDPRNSPEQWNVELAPLPAKEKDADENNVGETPLRGQDSKARNVGDSVTSEDEFLASPSSRVHEMLRAAGQLRITTEIPFHPEGAAAQVCFLIPCGAHQLLGVEDLFTRLSKLGVGVSGGEGWASLLPLSILRGIELGGAANVKSSAPGDNNDEEARGNNASTPPPSSIKSRIIVSKLVNLVRSSAALSFDYICLCLVASILSCVGLAVNNNVVIVASMLVSPLMGPILEVTLGTTMYNWKMVYHGLKSEVFGILICVFVGFCGGLCELPLAEANNRNWPGSEMTSRGDFRGFYVGIAIAIPSGVGVALSVLGNNTSSLVGVAISASLLPPAVNTGMLFAYAALNSVFPIEAGDERTPHTTSELVVMGAWSLLLTTANIFCIWIAGVIMFRVKEVTPIPDKSDFWDVHIPNVRKQNRVIRKGDDNAIAKRVKDMLRLVNGGNAGGEASQHMDLSTLSASKPRRTSIKSILNPNLFTDPSNDEARAASSEDEGSAREKSKSQTGLRNRLVGRFSARHKRHHTTSAFEAGDDDLESQNEQRPPRSRTLSQPERTAAIAAPNL